MPTPKSLLKGFAKTVANAEPDPRKRLTISDPDTRGLYLRITPAGAKTYTIVARNPQGKQVWREVGSADVIDLEDARTKAKEGVRRIKQGLEAFPEAKPAAPPRTFAIVRDDFLKRHVRKEGQKDGQGRPIPPLRSAQEIHRILCGPKYAKWICGGGRGEAPAIASPYIPKAWNDRPFVDIRRVDITETLDTIEDENGATQASAVLAQLSSLCSWQAARDDDYTSPIVRGMKRTKIGERARKRVLTDDEIRKLWNVCAGRGVFGAFVQTCLLTAQRRAKVAKMRWDEISDEGVWTIPGEDREKGHGNMLKLPALALDIIRAQPVVAGNPSVFAGRGAKAMNSFSQHKADLDENLPINDWVIHDLRRTAKTLMRRARVDSEISERVLGHVIEGVEGVYDRHSYFDEKGEALAALAALVDRIVNPPADNVVEMAAAR